MARNRTEGEEIRPDDLTKTQFRVLRFLLEFRRRHGRSPSGSELAGHFGWASTTSAYNHITALVRKEYLFSPFKDNRLNAWKPTPRATRFEPDALTIVSGGDVGIQTAAGEGNALHSVVDLVPGVRSDDIFCHVTSDALIGIGIGRGTIAIARPGVEPQDGALSVLNYRSRLLLRFLRYTTKGVRLTAANEHVHVLHVAFDDITIVGPVIATVRTNSFV